MSKHIQNGSNMLTEELKLGDGTNYFSVSTSGTISQILKGTGIDGTGKTISSILKIKLYRDDNVYTGDMLCDQFDIHVEQDSFGSSAEYTK